MSGMEGPEREAHAHVHVCTSARLHRCWQYISTPPPPLSGVVGYRCADIPREAQRQRHVTALHVCVVIYSTLFATFTF